MGSLPFPPENLERSLDLTRNLHRIDVITTQRVHDLASSLQLGEEIVPRLIFSAEAYGLISVESRKIRVTTLGIRCMSEDNPVVKRGALAQAFLKVSAYREYARRHPIPNMATMKARESEIQELGINGDSVPRFINNYRADNHLIGPGVIQVHGDTITQLDLGLPKRDDGGIHGNPTWSFSNAPNLPAPSEHPSPLETEGKRTAANKRGEVKAEREHAPVEQEQSNLPGSIKLPRCFIAMPFTEHSPAYEKGFFDEVLKTLLEPAVKAAGLEPFTAREEGSDLIHATIVNDLLDADLVLVDLTEHNPNVLFELGIRMHADKPVVLIKAKGTGKIFDVDSLLRVLEYDPHLWQSTIKTDVENLTKHISGAWSRRRSSRTYMQILRTSRENSSD